MLEDTRSTHTDAGDFATSRAVKKAPFHIPSLDGLRAISFLIVFVAHAGLGRVIPGGFGVTVFFFLSGFLITTLMRQEFDKYGSVSFKLFYLRRILRILPPFYAVLLLSTGLALVHVVPGDVELRSFVAQAGHYANYFVVNHGYVGFAKGTDVYWSLAVEEHFYLFFPLLFSLLATRRVSGKSMATVFAALCFAVLCWRVWLVYGMHAPLERTYVATDTRIDSILFGCILAVHKNPMLDELPDASLPMWKYVLLPLGLLVLLLTFVIRNPEFRESFRYSVQGIALYPVFVVAMRAPQFFVFPLLNRPWMAFVGTLSYSLYLVHYVVIFTLDEHLRLEGMPRAVGGVLRGSLALAISLLLSYAIYRGVEKPCATLRKKYASR